MLSKKHRRRLWAQRAIAAANTSRFPVGVGGTLSLGNSSNCFERQIEILASRGRKLGVKTCLSTRRFQAACTDVVGFATKDTAGYVYNQLVSYFPDWNRLQAVIREHRIETELYLHLQECFRNLGYHQGDFPLAERTA